MENEITEQVSDEPVTDLLGEGTGTDTPETTAPPVLTEERIRAIMREERALTVKQTAEETAKAYRALQSMSDKKAAQVRNMAQQQVEAMKATGAQITPEMETNYVSLLVNKYQESLADEVPESAQAQPSKDGDTSTLFDSAKVAVNRTAKKLGVTVDDATSTELNTLWKSVNSWDKYEEFLDSAEELLKAKVDKNPPQSRMPSTVGNSGSSKPTVESYKKEVMAHQGDPKAILAIQEKYTKAGLDISQVRFTQSRK